MRKISVGDIVKEEYNENIFKNMNPGSMIKVTEGSFNQEGGDPKYCVIMRCHDESGIDAICVGSDIDEAIGRVWGTILQSYTYKVLLIK